MAPDLDTQTSLAIELCRSAHTRLLATATRVTDEQVRSPSRLPDWTIGHVLTHLARNAEGHVTRLEAALRGEDVPRYPGGSRQRDAAIAAGSSRSAAEMAEDLAEMQSRLEQVWERSTKCGWEGAEFRGGDGWGTPASPARRLEEVEIHHVDLGLGYEPSDWPEEYAGWELERLLKTVPERARRPGDVRELVVWLAGRGPVPTSVELDRW